MSSEGSGASRALEHCRIFGGFIGNSRFPADDDGIKSARVSGSSALIVAMLHSRRAWQSSLSHCKRNRVPIDHHRAARKVRWAATRQRQGGSNGVDEKGLSSVGLFHKSWIGN